MDTFENPAPVGDSTTGNSTNGSDNIESFDSFEVKELPENETSSKETEDKTNLKDKQINSMDNAKEEEKSEKEEEDKEDEKDGEDEKGSETESDGRNPEDGKSDAEKNESDAPKAKMLKASVGDDKVEINPEAELKVKVDGKRVSVKVNDLINNYSGKVSWDKKYTELGREKEAHQAESAQYKQELGWMQDNIKEVVGILDSDDRNPIDALMHLVDVTNRNPVQFQQKLFKHMQSEMEDMMDMDEIEQELHWERQKNNYLSKRQESSTAQARSDTEARELKARIDGMREAQGVDESQFMEAHSELEDLGFEDVTPEQAVNYASIKPHLDVAEELIKPFEEEMTSDGADKLISDFANYLKSGEFTQEELQALLKEEYVSDSEINDLEKKVQDFSTKQSDLPSKVADKGEGVVESFEDFDEHYYGRNF
jgi:hypothetical protein